MRNQSITFLGSVAVAMLTGLVLFLGERKSLDPARPADFASAAPWLRDHPADWQAASMIVEQSLDLPADSRFALWGTSSRLMKVLAPTRPQAAAAFVRGGFFHWYELPERDRKEVLLAVTPLLRDRDYFARLHNPVWQLTGDIAFLRRANPGTAWSVGIVRDIAATNGFFGDYRELREEARKLRNDELIAALGTLAPEEIIQRFPQDFDRRDDELVRRALDELQRRPLDANPNRGAVLDRIVDYALRLNAGPLQGLQRAATESGWASEATRARLAAHLRGEPDPREVLSEEWMGFCGSDVCNSAARFIRQKTAATIALPLTVVQTDEVWPYVESYMDYAPVEEFPVERQARLRLPVDAGVHILEVRVINPLTRNLTRRRIRIL